MFNIDELRQHIEALIRDYPDLAEDEDLRADMLDGHTNIIEVLTSLFRTIDNNRMMVLAVSDRMGQLNERRARFNRKVEAYRELMLKILQSADLRKVELPEATLSQRNGPPQILGEVDVSELPDDLVNIRREASRTKIREALLSGREVPGMSLSNAMPSLTINVK